MLGGAVHRALRATHMAHLRGNLDQRARQACTDQPTRHLAGQVKGGLEVEVNHSVKISVQGLGDQRGAVGAGAVDQNLERPGVGQGLFHSHRVGDIQHQHVGLGPIGTQSGSGSMQLGTRTGCQRDHRPGLCQGMGCGQPNAPTRPGHQGAAAIQAERGRDRVDHGRRGLAHGARPGRGGARSPRSKASQPSPWNGSTPSCCITCGKSTDTQLSTILPSCTFQKSM